MLESGKHCLSLVLVPGPPHVTEQPVHDDHSFHWAVVEAGVVVTIGHASGLQASLSVPSPVQVLEGSEPGLHSPVLVLSPPPQVAEQSLQAVQQPY